MIKSILDKKVKVKSFERSIQYRTKIDLVEKMLRQDINIDYTSSFHSDFEGHYHVIGVIYLKGTKDKILRKYSKDFDIYDKIYLPNRLADWWIFDSKHVLVFVPKVRII